ncbi:MAG: hypothetical protein RI894_1186 [Bacteroidota bacterium]
MSEPNTGRILFYTNGISIQDSTKRTMLNGDSINYGGRWIDDEEVGYRLFQGAFILPKPNSSTQYYLLHQLYDRFLSPSGGFDYYVTKTYFSLIDMTLNNGRGKVVQKNQLLMRKNTNPIIFSATKHANGRDYWVMTQSIHLDTFFRFLVTPQGIQGPFTQVIGRHYTTEIGGGSAACFSPNGEYFALFDGATGVQTFDFDRCTGLLSNFNYIPRDRNNPIGGISFSPNSRFCYVSNYNHLAQIDMTNNPLRIDTIAVIDGFQDTIHNNGNIINFGIANFLSMQLAPDNKIYITCFSDHFYYSIIDNPDALGAACNVQQHALRLPTVNNGTIPHNPNYRLGALTGSTCDTLTSADESLPSGNFGGFRLFPNPASDHTRLAWNEPLPYNALLQLTNSIGQTVRSIAVEKGFTYQEVNLKGLTNGVYFLHFPNSEIVKLIKME